ncbi:LysM peptidoglycan-binding domain-containing protein [Aspergillus clavatus NRRL 1]|uniref:LysM domain protein n=1 Tax=Aspergillus clavatus (strain ATCC 1007 / CBS 513.65 / DSM 816 / NCTC 3887 / NRRL 1 / QM 1276 / 107) TaxID=344612 RepID=A1CPL4_ASPCL|nr:LysM domain protein [Aspergillus clavatus NRRL 1]EAW07585.1 LysM domain protein [Aspergillus clavatus NRRL 1]
MKPSLCAFAGLVAGPVAAQIQLYQYGLNSTATLSAGCSTALKATLQCDPYLYTLATNDHFGSLGNKTFQDQLCQGACGTSLTTYHNTVVEKCASDPQPWDGVPAVWAGDILWATYNRTCLKDPKTNVYCTEEIGDIQTLLGDTDSTLTTLSKDQLCSPCVLSLIQQMQATAYSNYDDSHVADWIAIQKTCQTGALPTQVQPPATNITEAPGVDYSTPGVATGPLRTLNGVFPDGSNLLAGQVLCLPRKCQIYKVKAGDTCATIADAYNLSVVDLVTYNPAVNRACSNLIADTNICVGPSGAQYTPTTIAGATATKTDEYATSTVTPDGPTASGTTLECGKYHQVVAGDTCEQISLKFAISAALFMKINPSIDQDCSSLPPGVYYCVFPTADWNATASGNTTTTTTSTYVTPPAPTPTGTTQYCYAWHVVVTGDQCSTLQAVFGISFTQLRTWNPQLNADCTNLLLNEAYCVKGDSGSRPTSVSVTPTSASATPTPTSVPAPGPTQTGIPANCNKWAMQANGVFCYDMAAKAGISLDELYKLNPALNGDCSGLWAGHAYCIGVSG